MNRIGVLHMVDTLETGGTERVAVNLSNYLPREQYRSYLCTTRHDGPLAEMIHDDVGRLQLRRKTRLDWEALWCLVKFIRTEGIRILHAHSSAIFLARAAAAFAPGMRVIWHDHYGRYATNERPVTLYRLATRHIAGVIAVNTPLAEWSRRKLGIPRERVWYVPNLVAPPDERCKDFAGELPGSPGSRIVCVANLRPQKDHLTLIHAMALVVQKVPSAHLLLLGSAPDTSYLQSLIDAARSCGLQQNVSYLGEVSNAGPVLSRCDIGVLSSKSEGLPLALLEYGMGGLPAVATRVGQCPEVLDEGRAGMLVAPGDTGQLAESLLSLLRSPSQRRDLGEFFRSRVEALFSKEPVMARICQIYETVLQ